MRRDRKPSLLGQLWMVSWRKVQGGRGWELSGWYPASWVLCSKGKVKDGTPLCVFGVLWPLLQCSLRVKFLDFPGGPVVKNLPPSAGDTGSIPGVGRFPHAEGQLSPGTTSTEPLCPTDHALQQEKPLQWEACAWQLESSPCSPQPEKSLRTTVKTQGSQKINKKKRVKFLLHWEMGDNPTSVDHEATALGEKLWEAGVGLKQRRQPLPNQNSPCRRQEYTSTIHSLWRVNVHKGIETIECQWEKHCKIEGKKINYTTQILIQVLLLLLSHFSRVQLCVTP